MRLLAALALVFIPLVPPSFHGCGGDGSDPPGPLPVVDAGAACVLDSECMPDACSDIRCVAGTCVEVAPLRDADRDGRSPPPCGDDCNDTDATIFPSASEICDGLDNDCDSTVDEDAPPAATRLDLRVGDRTSILLPGTPGFLLTDISTGGLVANPIAPGGAMGIPVEVLRPEGSILATGAAARADGRSLVAAMTSGPGREVRWAILRPIAGSVEVESDGSFGLTGAPRAIAVVPHADGWAVAFDVIPDAGSEPRRFLTFLPSASPGIVEIPDVAGEDLAPLGLASDGTEIAVTGDASVQFFDDAGTRTANHAAPGPLAFSALATGDDDDVIVSWADSFDWNVAHLSSAAPTPTGTQPVPRLGTSELTDRVELARAGTLLVITRASDRGTAAIVLRTDDLGPIRSYDEEPISGSFRGTPSRVSVAHSDSAVGILSAFDAGGSALAVLACGTL